MIRIRTHKAARRKYRIQVQAGSGGRSAQTCVFSEYSDHKAILRLIALLKKLLPGSRVVLSRLNERIGEWEILRHAGKE